MASRRPHGRPSIRAVAALTFAACALLGAQAPKVGDGPSQAFFDPPAVHRFHLTIAPADWQTMEPVRGQGFGPPPPGGEDFAAVSARLEFDDQAWGDLRVRFKGNSSFNAARDSLKRSFKLDFNDIAKDRTFFGLTKLNLNNNAMDPSAMRETLGYDVFRRASVIAPRTSFAQLFLTVPGLWNRQYVGLYTAVEQIDQTFLSARFGKKAGLLLKPERLNGQPYLGEQWRPYADRYGEKITTNAADGARFVALARLIAQASDQDFASGIDALLDVDAFLRFVAVEAMLTNLDSPLVSGHNYYLTMNPTSHKVTFLPWDLNEAFGGFMAGASAHDLSIRRPFAPGAFRLAERLLAIPARRDAYDAIVRDIVATNFTVDRLRQQIGEMATTIRGAVASDRWMNVREFERNIADDPGPAPARVGPPIDGRGFGPGPPPGARPGGPGGNMGGPPRPLLRQFIGMRVESVRDQLAGSREGFSPERPGPGRGRMGGG